MIVFKQNIFQLETNTTGYYIRLLPSGHLEHLHYGGKLFLASDEQALWEKHNFPGGCQIIYDKNNSSLCLDNLCLEMSSWGRGDTREPFVELLYEDGSTTSDFLYQGYVIDQGKEAFETLPASYANDSIVDHLCLILEDKIHKTRLELHYWVYPDCDVISRSAKLTQMGEQSVTVKRLMSMQLDFSHNNYCFTNFTGAWAREMNRMDHPCHQGRIVNESVAGCSSNRNNPFVMLSSLHTTEEYGECYACNLIYSGNHYEVVEVNSYGKLHFLAGIQPRGFSYLLKQNQSFEAPEVVLTWSNHGFGGMSHHMHRFIQGHIVRGEWAVKERPVLFNSWEAAYFKFNESKLLKLAKAAKELGIELFVLDDGWFGERNDDTSSLGDWEVNTKKLPHGLEGLVNKVNRLGLSFGLWVEPEMVNVNSNLYREHPEWAVKIPNQSHSEGRNQLILDLSNPLVQDYLIESMSRIFSCANIQYVKWDMNRVFSEYYSNYLPANQQGEMAHRYMMGLYRVLARLTERFPQILFEGCASGGNRFDLGILCYMPQIWASDNTDAICRAKIQTGYSYGYPMSVLTSHVSGSPNHQTLRKTPLETRFNVACFGILGYECNLSDLKEEEQKTIKEQITFYKKHRSLLQYGQYYRVKNGEHTDFESGIYQWNVVDQDKSSAIALLLQELSTPNYGFACLKVPGLEEGKIYHFYKQKSKHNVKVFGDLINTMSPIHIKQDSALHFVVSKVVKLPGEIEDYQVSGSLLKYAGVRLKQGYLGTGFDDQTRLFYDFSSRLYIMEELRNDEKSKQE